MLSILGLFLNADNLLTTAQIKLVKECVYEVIVPKATNDSLTYEKPLPMDLIPFAIRNDDYHSIGSAFAIAENKLVSAAHVFNIEASSQFKDLYIRDRQQNIYKINKILRYSSRRDFIVFSLQERNNQKFLPLTTNTALDEQVWAVGNALGEGIVLRDGLLTSRTYEEINGVWKWLRFSAAASPGNSGGPLINREGKVVGVITMKSPNENLNYALPVSAWQTPRDGQTAFAFRRYIYKLNNTRQSERGIFSNVVELPMDYHKLRTVMTKAAHKRTGELLTNLLQNNKKHFFPLCRGSEEILHDSYNAVFPHIIAEGDDSKVYVFSPSEQKTVELGENGYFKYGSIFDIFFLYMRKPDNVKLSDFYQDSSHFMDFLLKGVYLRRYVGNMKIRITSMGKAKKKLFYTDNYGRKWIVRIWNMEYNDRKIISFSLPVPGGLISMFDIAMTDAADHALLQDYKVLADFIYLSYYGTFKQWREFLELEQYLPELMHNLTFAFRGTTVSFKSSAFSMELGDDVFELTARSDMKLYTDFFRKQGKVVWDLAGILIGEDKNNENYFIVSRTARPLAELDDEYQSSWRKIISGRHPYEGKSFFEDGKTRLSTVHPSYEDAGLKTPFVYTVKLIREGQVRGREMRKMKDAVNEAFTFSE